MTDGSAAIYPHHLGLFILRGISSTGPFGHAKQCAINAFDTNYRMSADEVIASILHMAQSMVEDLPSSDLRALCGSASPISAFVGAGCGSQGGRGHGHRGGRGGRGLQKTQCVWQPRPYSVVLHSFGRRNPEVDPLPSAR
jgi:hypothetical protein